MKTKVINIDPEILGGTPVFFGTRVPVKNLFDYIETGETIDEFLNDFEGVKKNKLSEYWSFHKNLSTPQQKFSMKILLDECVTRKLREFLPSHECFTVTEMKWNGLKNGKLMEKCVENRFDVWLTIDKNLLPQQNFKKYNLAIIVFDSETSKLRN